MIGTKQHTVFAAEQGVRPDGVRAERVGFLGAVLVAELAGDEVGPAVGIGVH